MALGEILNNSPLDPLSLKERGKRYHLKMTFPLSLGKRKGDRGIEFSRERKY